MGGPYYDGYGEVHSFLATPDPPNTVPTYLHPAPAKLPPSEPGGVEKEQVGLTYLT